jgi:hypothetical protein
MLITGAWLLPMAAFAEMPARWIVAVAPGLGEAIEPLVQQRRGQGMDVVVVQIGDVLSIDEIRGGDGRKLWQHLKRLCREAKRETSILLVGAAVAGNSAGIDTFLPPLIGTTGRMKGEPSDNGYGCLDDGDGKLMPMIAVGRLPARSAAEARGMVQKIISFEDEGKKRAAAAWRRRITILAGNPGGTATAQDTLANLAGGGALQVMLDWIDPSWDVRAIFHVPGSPFYVPDRYLHDEALGLMRQGQAFTFYMGHSGPGGFASGQGRYLDREDFATMKLPAGGGAGIFITCGCFSCQLRGDGGEGHGLAAIRNPGGPVAVIGAHGESYAAAGQLAFGGLNECFRTRRLPARLGECYLHMKAGLARGDIGFITFKVLDDADGSRGTIPLEVQRLEHLEMWMLLGDPATMLPASPAEIRLQTPESVGPGAALLVRGALPEGSEDTLVRVSVLRPMSGAPVDLETVPEAAGEARDRVILANHLKANQAMLLTRETTARGGRFEASIEMPQQLPWPRVIVKAQAVKGEDGDDAMAAVSIPVKQINK